LQEQRAINELENINIVLLEIKSEIKNRHLPMINESYKDYIQDSYDKAAQIQAFRQSRPVELTELSQKVDDARDIIYKLYDNVHNLIVTAEMVEEAIVYGNRYRSTFMEVNTELTKAEVLFRNGEYTKALSTAVDIIEKIKPGSYEELIKKSTISNLVMLIKQILKYGVKKNMLSPFTLEISYIPEMQNSKNKVFTDEEQDAIIEAVVSDLSFKSFGILLSLITGMRIGELCALHWSDIDCVQKVITIQNTLQRVYQKDMQPTTKIIV